MAQLIECQCCQKQLSSEAVSCPHCGQPQPRLVECQNCKKMIAVDISKCPDCGALQKTVISNKLATFVAIGAIMIVIGLGIIISEVASISPDPNGKSSVDRKAATTATILLCAGTFIAIGPFCKKKQ